MHRILTIVMTALVIAGCANQSHVQTDVSRLSVPDSWTNQSAQGSFDLHLWQGVFSPQLIQVIQHALENNFQLKQQQASLNASKQNLIASGAVFWPSLDAGLDASRRKNQPSGDLSSSFGLSLDLRYEVDIWGKLSDSHQQTALLYSQQNFQLQQFRSDLIRRVISAWFNVVESRQQLALNELRLTNSQQNLEIIESGYESGLNDALDVYLTRNEVANERARVASQKNILSQNLRALELLLGQYPGAEIAVTDQDIPTLNKVSQLGLPSELIARKPSLQASWMSVLAKDAEVAFRYKQRFPSLTLSTSAGTSSDDLSDLLSSDFAWSLIGNLTAPIFEAGRLKANEQQSRFELQQTEQAYLESLFNAFSEVENALTNETSLSTNFLANIEAAENATFAESLSFEQYQKGLVSYTTVLDAQARAFNAQSTVIQLKYQLLDNRLQLFSALGGDFSVLFSKEDQL